MTMKVHTVKKILVAAAFILSSLSLFGELKTWVGGDGLWYDPDMWEPAGVPAVTDDILIENGTCTYVPGGDININGSLTVGPGGTWKQSDAGSWIQLRGNLLIAGGTFDCGGSGKLSTYDGFSLTLTSGTLRCRFNLDTDFIHSPSVALLGGSIETAGELKFNLDTDIVYNLNALTASSQCNLYSTPAFVYHSLLERPVS